MRFSSTWHANKVELGPPQRTQDAGMSKHEVREWIDIYQARRAVKELAAAVGFKPPACNELAIVASELASNIVKYGVRGSLAQDPIANAEGPGIQIVARDFGPPFHDLASALRDGYDDKGPIDPLQMIKRRGIGGGLGAVVRLTHYFRVDTLRDGKEIWVVRYLNRRLGNPTIVLQ